MSESARWILLKQDGNKKYQAGDYEGAEALYTKAYVEPVLFVGSTNSLPPESLSTLTAPFSTQIAPWRASR